MLVHCLMGQNRSATLVVFLVAELGSPPLSLHEAYSRLVALRPWTSLTEANRKELIEWEKRARGSVSITAKDW